MKLCEPPSTNQFLVGILAGVMQGPGPLFKMSAFVHVKSLPGVRYRYGFVSV
jgi:hypothetical protein